MPPSTVAGFLLLVAVVLPGAIYQWAFERQVSAFGVSFADRLLRFVAVSVIFHLILGWPEYLVYRLLRDEPHPYVAQFAAAWIMVLAIVAFPAVAGSMLGGLYASKQTREGWSWARRWLSASTEERLLRAALGRTPAPRAWDHLFSDRPTVYLRVRTVDGDWLAGRFAGRSYASGFPHEVDLYLEEAWEVDDDGQLGKSGLGYPLWIPGRQIAWVEVVDQVPTEPEAAYA
jgi:branched-subunit amino acid ABC-type transport system permease component